MADKERKDSRGEPPATGCPRYPLVLAVALSAAASGHAATAEAAEPTVAHLEKDAGRLLVLGTVLTTVGTAFLIGSVITFEVEEHDTDDTSDDQTWPDPLYFVTIAFGSMGALGVLPGFPLLIAGAANKHQARLLSEGKVGDQTVGIRGDTIRNLVLAGYSVGAFSLASLLASWIGFVVSNGLNSGKGATRALLTWLILNPTSAGLMGTASPMLLGSYAKTRKALGLRPANGLVVAGWLLYSCTLLTSPLSLGLFVAAPIFTGCLVSSFIVGVAAGKRAIANLEKIPDSAADSGTMQVVPFATGIEGGFMAGVAGTF